MNRCDPLDWIRVVLCTTTHPGNIGAAARALKTMGLCKLYLVNPRYFPHPDATAMAAGAADVLDRAIICASLEEALAGTVKAIGCSARRRDLPLRVLNFRDAASELIQETTSGEVAVVYGTEMSGLTNNELSLCRELAYLPANPSYSSLNLAHAVQVMAYELRMALPDIETMATKTYEAASFEEIELLFRHFEEKMIAVGFLNPQNPKRLMQRLRRLFARTQLEKLEVNILRGFLNAIKEENTGGTTL